jgi:signal transduction histidine kinase
LSKNHQSIRKNLTLGLIYLGLGILFCLFLLNLYISSRLAHEYDITLHAKVSALETMIKQHEAGVEFDFADEFMPEFSRERNPEYFQIWIGQEILERSKSLNNEDLPKISQLNNTFDLADIILPDHRKGRMIQTTVFAQIVNRSLRGILKPVQVTLVFAKDREDLDQLLSYLKLDFLLFGIVIILASVYIVQQILMTSFKPLSVLTKQVKSINTETLNTRIQLAEPVNELLPLIKQFNLLLEEIEDSFHRERRYSSDLAHELRTPIAEIRSLAEVGLRCIDDKALVQDFNHEIVDAASQMERVLHLLLELARHENNQININVEVVELHRLIHTIWKTMKDRADNKKIQLVVKCPREFYIKTGYDQLKLMLVNLLNNAVSYSASNSNVIFKVTRFDNTFSISINNQINNNLQSSDLPLMFNRLWRKDVSRTSNQNAGLGLTLVKAYAQQLQMKIHTLLADNRYTIILSGVLEAMQFGEIDKKR